MDGRKNNVGTKGNRGGGRSSAYQEHNDAEWHAMIWKEDQDVCALEDKVRNRKYSVRDIAALKVLKGDRFLIGKFMDKLLPDLRKDEVLNPIQMFGLTEDEKRKIEKLFPRD